MNSANTEALRRSELWSAELKMVLEEDLNAIQWVDMLDGFPDGDTFTIPSIGTSQVDDYVEGGNVQYRPMDTGEFQFTIDEYISSGTSISRKAEQDSFYSSQLISSFVPSQRRAIMEHFEGTVLSKPEAVMGATANSNYAIDGVNHRFSGGNAGRLELQDFAYADYALNKANVPVSNRVAVVDPSVAFDLNTLGNLVNVSNNPQWEGIVADGISTGMRFVKNVYGFDVWVSSFLPDITAGALPDRGGANAVDYSSTTGKASYFFSASSEVLPIKAAWRQQPIVDAIFDQDKQETKFVTTARYGTKLFRPENMVIGAHIEAVS